jgi:hypothetical protein
MTTKVRTLLSVVAIGSVSVFGGGALAAGTSETPSAAQYAVIAENVCAGVPAREREMGLLAYRDAIVSVAPLKEDYFMGKARTSRTIGAFIELRATPSITKPWLERVNSCHVALVGSGQVLAHEAAADPFVVAGTSLVAAEKFAGYVLFVKGVNADTVQEITKRSLALLSKPNRTTTASLESR